MTLRTALQHECKLYAARLLGRLNINVVRLNVNVDHIKALVGRL